MSVTVGEFHARSLALVEGRRLIDIKEAARYLGRSYQHVHGLVKQQKIQSGYDGGRRMVVVADLIRYAEQVERNIDPPEVSR